MGKRKKEENPASREEKQIGQPGSTFQKLTAEEIFQLAAHLEVRSTAGAEIGSQYSLHPYIE